MENISKYRTELMGLSILWIVFYHSGIFIPDFMLPLKFFKAIGYAGVDVFFLLSGLGLTFSFSKDSSLISFYWKRLIRVIPAYWACLCLIFFIGYVARSGVDFSSLLLSLFGVDFFVFGNLTTWFIPSIFVCYVIFPGLFSLALKYGYGRILLVFSLLAIGVSLIIIGSPLQHLLILTVRLPVFALGVYIGFLLINRQESIVNNLYLNVFVLLLSMIVLGGILLKIDGPVRWQYGLWWYPTIFMAFPIAMLAGKAFGLVGLENMRPINMLRSLGVLSLEIYLIHSFIFKLAESSPVKNHDLNFFRVPEYVLYFVIAFVLAKLISALLGKINWDFIRERLLPSGTKS